jgi:hypothetical protein
MHLRKRAKPKLLHEWHKDRHGADDRVEVADEPKEQIDITHHSSEAAAG